METAHIASSSATEAEAPDGNIVSGFASGAVMRKLGFDNDTLRLGLTVASQQMQRGALAEAIQTYTSLIVCNPLDIDFHIGLSTCALRMERADVALRSASLVIGLAQADPRGYLLSAQALLMLREPTAALTDARTAIELTEASSLAPDICRRTRAAAERIVASLGLSGSA